MGFDVLQFWEGHDPNSIAIEHDKNKISYYDLNEKIDCNIEFFKQTGLKEMDHVILLINHQKSYIDIFLALWKLNVTMIPIDIQISNENFRNIIRDSDADYIISDHAKKLVDFEKEPGSYPCLKKILVINEHDYQVLEINNKAKHESWLLRQSENVPTGFFMLFTSGTSGKSKGVVLKKEAFLNNVQKVIKYTGLTESDVLLLNLPLSYSFAISQVCAHLIVGGTVVLSENNVYNSLILYEIKEKKITNFPATPYFYETLVKEIDKNSETDDIGILKFFMSAGGYINPYVIEKIVTKFPSVIFYNNYGQTEASPRISYSKFTDHSAEFQGVGHPLPGVSVSIFDEDGKNLEDGQIGEIGYKSEDLMLGYYKNEILDSKQDFMSGDLGYFDHGSLVIVGRKDSLMKINGRKVYKNYIENLIYQLPYVSNVKIKKEKHNIYGEYFIAYVIPKENEDENMVVNNIHEYCKKNLNSYERPKKIVICNEIHLSSNKKVQLSVHKNEVKDMERINGC